LTFSVGGKSFKKKVKGVKIFEFKLSVDASFSHKKLRERE